MDKKLLILVIIVVLGLVYYFGFAPKEQAENTQNSEEQSQIASPAAVKCEQEGGVLESVEFEAGTDAYCVFDDGSRCWEWDFFNGNCGKGDLKTEVLQGGMDRRAAQGDTVAVHYAGKLEDGTKFDSSIDRGEPFSFTLGEGRVIQGWEQGVLGMKVGEQRKLTIAPALGYGEAGVPGAIPGNSTLIFEVELLAIAIK